MSEAQDASRKEEEQRKLEEILERINYSDRYSDDVYEYRHVIMPKQLLRYIPDTFWDQKTGALRLLAEKEWRAIGIQQSLGWEHYEIHAPEPHVLLFRRPKDYVPSAQPTVVAGRSRK
ncbi:CKS-domain-containing protein [Marasmius fiardii PR-910]|nr:CKS-domain-containing protein [Marasmius fiardii PR-910]